jgi:hypothetical protein
MSDWTAYTPTFTWTTNASHSGQWRRVGDSINVLTITTFSGANTQGGPGAISLPPGLSIDVTKLPTTATSEKTYAIGTWQALDSGTNSTYSGIILYRRDTGNFSLAYPTSSTTATALDTSVNLPFTIAANDTISCNFTLPISGWTANVAGATSANALVLGGQSVGSTLTFGATSNQGFSILANNAAAISSTAAGALTLGLPSKIGSNDYAGQAIVGRTNGVAISAGYVGETITATSSVTTGTTTGTTIATTASITPGLYLVTISGASVYSSGSISVLAWTARLTTNASLLPSVTDFYTNQNDSIGFGNSTSVSTAQNSCSTSRTFVLQVTSTAIYYLRAAADVAGGGTIGLKGNITFVRIA